MALLTIRKEWIETEPKIIGVLNEYFDYMGVFIEYPSGETTYEVHKDGVPEEGIKISVTFRYNENQ